MSYTRRYNQFDFTNNEPAPKYSRCTNDEACPSTTTHQMRCPGLMKQLEAMKNRNA